MASPNIFPAVCGSMQYAGGRIIIIDGVAVEIPRNGYAFIGEAVVAEGGAAVIRGRQCFGPLANRFSFIKIGDSELETIRALCENSPDGSIPYMFSTLHPRPKASLN